MNRHYQSTVLVIAVGIVMVAAARPAHADLGDQLFKLLADDGNRDDQFGISVAISGDIVIVAADFGDAAYLFDTTTGKQLFKLLPDDGEQGDIFGSSVAISPISGAIAIVGAIRDNDNGFHSGSAYLFDTSTGRQLFKLLPDDGAEGDVFGRSVAVSGTTVIVGAHFNDDNGRSSGSAYLFDRLTGRQLFKLLPGNGAQGDHFGFSVAISGDTAIVGARNAGGDIGSGSAYLFDTISGQELHELVPDDGDDDDHFGVSVAISGDIAIVGAWLDDDNGRESGSAYLFDVSDPANPIQLAKLLPDDGAIQDRFGISVAISGDIAIVGAWLDDDNGAESGSAYLFDISHPDPIQIAKLLPDDGAADDWFGASVTVSGDIAIVGALQDDDNGENSGSVYLFDGGAGTPATLTGLAILDGTLVFGGLPELEESDDAHLQTRARVTGEVHQPQLLRMRVTARTDVQDASTIRITIEGRVSPVVAQTTLSLRDWINGGFVQVDQFTMGRSDSVRQIEVSDAARFVRTTDGRISLEIKQIVFFPFTLDPFRTNFDLVEIAVR